MNLVRSKLFYGVFIITALISMSVQGDVVEQTLSKVSIVVDGMMKSKSGAT